LNGIEPRPSRPEAIRLALKDWLTGKTMLVAARRRMISVGVHGNKNATRAPGAAYAAAVGPNITRSEEVKALQGDIDAVNRAILDERDALKRGEIGESE